MPYSVRSLLFAGLMIAGCSTGTGLIEVEEAWTRPTPPNVKVAAFYFRLANGTDLDSAIVGASSEHCEDVEIHTVTFSDDLVEMGIVDRLEVPAGQSLALEPNSLHLMCVGLAAPLEAGDLVDMTLELEGDLSILVHIDVRSQR